MRFSPKIWPLGTLLLLGSCQTQPDAPEQFAYSPTITVFTQEPADKTMPAAERRCDLPPGMVYVPGGYTQIGSEDGTEGEKPQFWVQVQSFLMDRHEVTVGEFRAFVQATGFRTDAEKYGDAGVFSEETRDWALTQGANWHHPYGPAADPAPDNMPVMQVSWHDANAYARWAGKRLPAEIEWEHAARNATNSRDLYPFGNRLTVNNKFLANTWNGTFPTRNDGTDGYHRAAPVGSFGQSPLGLADLSGNVWEWCADPKMAYSDLLKRVPVVISEQTERVQRGGSYLCEPGWCHGYRVSGRAGSTPETALMHTGFRCVMDI